MGATCSIIVFLQVIAVECIKAENALSVDVTVSWKVLLLHAVAGLVQNMG